MTNQDLARKEQFLHGLFTWVLFGTLLSVTILIMVGTARFLRPQTMLVSLGLLTVLNVTIWIFGHKIVPLLTRSDLATGEELDRIERLMQTFLPRTHLSMPALYVSDMDAPNAFAFGSRLLGTQSVAVTRPLMRMLKDDELAAVLAHECGHLAARDTTLMVMVSVLLTWCNQLVKRLRHIGHLGLWFAFVLQLLLYVPKVVSKGISQLREFSADCYSARMIGTPDPLIRALRALDTWVKTHRDDTKNPVTGPLDDLMISHPHTDDRCQRLADLSFPPTPNPGV